MYIKIVAKIWRFYWGILLQFARDWEKIIERYFTPIRKDWNNNREIIWYFFENNLCQMCRPFYIIFTLLY